MADSTVTALAALLKARGAGVDGLLVHEDGRAVNAARFGYLSRQTRQRVADRPLPLDLTHLRLRVAVRGRLGRCDLRVPR